MQGSGYVQPLHDYALPLGFLPLVWTLDFDLPRIRHVIAHRGGSGGSRSLLSPPSFLPLTFPPGVCPASQLVFLGL
jgi:hypothetical protein